MPKPDKTHATFTISLPIELNKKFEEYCQKQQRSKNKQIIFLIEKALEEYDKNPK